MLTMDLELIKKNFEEYFEIALYSYGKGKYNSAVTLFYKALVELCDYELIKKLNIIGANHTERFKLLEKHSPELYSIASKMFKYYRDSYNNQISKNIAEVVRRNVENAKRIVLSD